MKVPDTDATSALTEHRGAPLALIVLLIMSSLSGGELQNNHPLCAPVSTQR